MSAIDTGGKIQKFIDETIERNRRKLFDSPTDTTPRGYKSWISYDAETGNLLIYFDGVPVPKYVSWINDRLATMHDCDNDAVVGVMIANA